jgi:hypothetical protein
MCVRLTGAVCPRAPAVTKVDQASTRRFTIDDGTMLVYFRCAEQVLQPMWRACPGATDSTAKPAE